MHIFIDESGIHKRSDRSSFVAVYVGVRDETAVSRGIQDIERRLGISDFHWADFGSRRGWSIRRQFIIKVSKLKFSFKYRIVDNPIDPVKELYDSMATLITEIDVEKVYIDGKKPKWYESQIKRSLRCRGLSVKSIKTVDDRSCPMIRLADALAWLVRSYHNKSTGTASELYRHISGRCKATIRLAADGQDAR
ncbi:MAG: DUF3800 domain-containing protein [Patescibacteria group bacterium]|nr:DUF3800 domain-containing protein [Patescibacteria group bacterium]